MGQGWGQGQGRDQETVKKSFNIRGFKVVTHIRTDLDTCTSSKPEEVFTASQLLVRPVWKCLHISEPSCLYLKCL